MENREQFLNKWKERLQDENALNRIVAKRFINIFQNAQKINEFDSNLFYMMVEKYTVNKEEIIICLLDETELILN